MMWLGAQTAELFGWTAREALFTGTAIAISSTTIIAKAFEEHRASGPVREIVVAVLVCEDLVAILVLALLPALAASAQAPRGEVLAVVGRLAAFLAAVMIAGLLVVPRVMRAAIVVSREETVLVTSVGLAFAFALMALAAGYSAALGAFLAGSLISEAGRAHAVERLVRPVRDVFSAIFFVAVGMQVEPEVVTRYATPVLVLTGVVLAGQIASVTVAAFLTGVGVRTAVRSAMSLGQIGEFSFVIARLGVSAITTLLTPWLIRHSGAVAAAVERTLPGPLQTFAALYGRWLERLRAAPARGGAGRTRRLVRGLLLDALLLTAVVTGVSLGRDRLSTLLERAVGVDPDVAAGLLAAVAVVLSAPFCLGILRVSHALAVELAERALPRDTGGAADRAHAARRALALALQIAVVSLIGMPLVAATQPFIPPFRGGLVLVVVLAALGAAFWMRATSLEGEVRAGAEAIVEALVAQARVSAPRHSDPELGLMREWLPALGDAVAVPVDDVSYAVGKSLGELNLRALTGATVLAIGRGEEGIVIPTVRAVLRSGDVLALAGTREAVEAATVLIRSGAQPIER